MLELLNEIKMRSFVGYAVAYCRCRGMGVGLDERRKKE